MENDKEEISMNNKLSAKLTYQLFIIVALLLAVSSIIYASPLKNIPVSVTQPNGDILKCLASGDEFFNYLHDASGNIIIQHPQTGYYTYAQLNVQGKVVASQQIAMDNGYYKNTNAVIYAPAIVKSNGLKLSDIDFIINADLIQTFPELSTAYSQSKAPLPEPAAEIGISAKTVKGIMENVIIMICFAGEDPTIDPIKKERIEAVFNGPARSLNHYMKAISENVFELHSTLVGTNGDTALMYQDSQPRNYYQPYNAVTNPSGYIGNERYTRESSLLRNSVRAIDGNILLLGKNLDIDHDGIVDSVTFIINGSTDGWNNLLWPHKYILPAENLNGKRIYAYSFQLLDPLFPASGISDLSALCHESLHTFDLPDLYRYTNSGYPVGGWDIMASTNNRENPQIPNSHSRLRYAGWGKEFVEISHNGHYVLSPIGSINGITAYAIATANPNEFILVEYRSDTNPSGYDTTCGSDDFVHRGLILTRINMRYNGNANASGTTNDEVYIYRPGETFFNRGSGSLHLASLAADISRISFGNDIAVSDYDGAIYLYDGTNTQYIISNVSAAEETISFDVKINNDPTDGHLITFLTSHKGILTADKNGSPFNSGDSVATGNSVTFHATPDTGYLVDKWFVNGVKVNAAPGQNTYTLNNINAQATVICCFEPDAAITAQTPVITTDPIDADRDFNNTTVTVTITTTTPGADIYYTLDGLNPGRNSLKYTGPFDVTASGFYPENKRVIATAVTGAGIPSDVAYVDIKFKALPDQDITAAFIDPNFLACVRELTGKPGGSIYASDVGKIFSLDVSGKNIADLSGIEYFTVLQSLNCRNNQLTALDISKNSKLEELYCYDNRLTELDISQNTLLADLRCHDNQLAELDVSRCTVITTLWCDNNKLTELDVSQNTVLSYLRCHNNRLGALDLRQNTALGNLYCNSNQLQELDVSHNTQLVTLHCQDNQLTELDVSQNTRLLALHSNNNQLTKLDISQNTNLSTLNCHYNYLLSEDSLTGRRDIYNFTFWPQYPVISIASQPAAEIFLTEGSIGGNLGIAVVTTQGATLQYQWYSNNLPTNSGGDAINGATSPNFAMPTNLTLGKYYYYCVATSTNNLGKASITSNVASVTVNTFTNAQLPLILAQPTDRTVNEGDTVTVTLTVAASVSKGMLSYQWYETIDGGSGTKINGAINSSYNAPVDTVSTKYYYCIIINTDITVNGQQSVATTSAAAMVRVKKPDIDLPIVITSQPAALTFVTQGSISGNLNIVAKASQGGTLIYQWYSNSVNSNSGGTPISGARYSEFPIPINLTAGTYYYYCTVSIVSILGGERVISDVAKITVTAAFLLGDIDGDGRVTLSDLSLLAQYFIGGYNIEERYPLIFIAGDMDCNGKLEQNDLSLLAQLIINARFYNGQ